MNLDIILLIKFIKMMLITLLKGYSKSTFTGQKKDVDPFFNF